MSTLIVTAFPTDIVLDTGTENLLPWKSTIKVPPATAPWDANTAEQTLDKLERSQLRIAFPKEESVPAWSSDLACSIDDRLGGQSTRWRDVENPRFGWCLEFDQVATYSKLPNPEP